MFVNKIYFERNMRRILEPTKKSEKEQLVLLCVVNIRKKNPKTFIFLGKKSLQATGLQ